MEGIAPCDTAGDILAMEPPALIGLCWVGDGPVEYGKEDCCGVVEGCEL